MSTKKKSKTTKLIWGIGIVVVAGLLVFPLLGRTSSTSQEATAKVGNIETYYSFSGNVESKNTQEVRAQQVTQISSIKISEGTKVKKDDVLFETAQGEKIKAKIDGTVSKIYVEENESVMAGANLCDITDFDNLQVTTKVDEYDLSSITVGKDVDVTINALDKTIKGKVADISDVADSQNGVAYFMGTIDLPKEENVKVGMTVEIKVLNKAVSNVVTIPMGAVQFDADNEPFVEVKGDKNQPTKQSVKLGINDGKSVEVVEGVTNNEVLFYPNTTTTKTNFLPPMQGK